MLERDPACLFLSFGDPRPFAAEIAAAGVPLICQVQTLDHARDAVEAGAQVIVAQGGEAGGHGASRAVMTLVPEVVDYLTRAAPEVLLLAAGGIADGRGLAAALMLGADGVLVGTRLWASAECLAPRPMLEAAVAAGGDATLRSSLPDIARGLDWPAPFTIRTVENDFTRRWQQDPEGLRAAGGEAELAHIVLLDQNCLGGGRPTVSSKYRSDQLGIDRQLRLGGFGHDELSNSPRGAEPAVPHCPGARGS